MDRKVFGAMEKFNMCPFGYNIVVGVSGGADSVSLLHYLYSNANSNNWTLHAVHVNHNLRGEDSVDDMNFVKNICEKWHVQCTVLEVDLEAESKKRKLGTEETGRLIRYECFRNVAKDMGENTVIAVAHNEDDQAETVLMRLCRGASLNGLGGIRPINGDIVRPLIFVSRAEIESYCTQNNLNFATDKTNFQTIYTRNKMRLDVLPKLQEIYPKSKKHIAKAGFYMAEENQFIDELMLDCFDDALVEKSNSKIVFDLNKLKNIHTVIKRRIFINTFNLLGLSKDFSTVHIESIIDLINDTKMKEISLPNDTFVKTSYHTLIFTKGKVISKDFNYVLNSNEIIYIEECGICIEIFIENGYNKLKNNCTKRFDCDKIKEDFSLDIFDLNELCCRNRKIGDKFIFNNNSKLLKKYFIDEKIPKESRDFVPLVALGNIVLWAVGFEISKKYLADENTKHCLIVEVKVKEK